MTVPPALLAAWRAQALSVLDDRAATVSRRRLAWAFLSQWGLK